MYSNYELWLIIGIIAHQESELVKIVKYYTKTYTIQTNEKIK